MKYLFVGGPADGRRINLPEGQRMYLYVERAKVPSSFEKFDVSSTCPTPRKCVYGRFRLHGNSEIFSVFVPAGQTPDALMALLIENYNPITPV